MKHLFSGRCGARVWEWSTEDEQETLPSHRGSHSVWWLEGDLLVSSQVLHT